MSHARNDGLDAIRAAGAILVVWSHLYNTFEQHWLGPIAGGGSSGIWLFFPLSGYLLYRPFVQGATGLRRYAIARTARILPAYYVVLGYLFLTGEAGEGKALSALFLQNIIREASPGWFGQSWTLGVEMAFYLSLPLLALGTARKGWLLAAIVALSWWFGAKISKEPWWYLQFPTLFWSFGVGMLLARYQERLRFVARVWPIGVVLVSLGILHLPGVRSDHAVTLGAAVLILASVEKRPKLPWARFPADISYGVYLWHQYAIHVFFAAGATGWILVGGSWALTIALGCLSFAVVERPAIRQAARWARKLEASAKNHRGTDERQSLPLGDPDRNPLPQAGR